MEYTSDVYRDWNARSNRVVKWILFTLPVAYPVKSGTWRGRIREAFKSILERDPKSVRSMEEGVGATKFWLAGPITEKEVERVKERREHGSSSARTR
jgi:hypothetical protein